MYLEGLPLGFLVELLGFYIPTSIHQFNATESSNVLCLLNFILKPNIFCNFCHPYVFVDITQTLTYILSL